MLIVSEKAVPLGFLYIFPFNGENVILNVSWRLQALKTIQRGRLEHKCDLIFTGNSGIYHAMQQFSCPLDEMSYIHKQYHQSWRISALNTAIPTSLANNFISRNGRKSHTYNITFYISIEHVLCNS